MYTLNSKHTRQLFEEHILEFYTLEDLRKEVENLKRHSNTRHFGDRHALLQMVQGGCFLVYYHDINKFLDSLELKQGKKILDDVDKWERYKNCIARFGETMIKP